MWTFLAALAGGLVAILGSVGTTYYVQRQAIQAERRARATRAADEILAAVTALRDLPKRPEEGALASVKDGRRAEWSDKKESLASRIQAQALLLLMPGLRERLTFVALANLNPVDLESFEGFTEIGARWSGSPGRLSPGLPQNPYVTVSRHTALAVLVIWRAGFTQAQCAKYRGFAAAAWLSILAAFFQVLCFLYLFMTHRSR
jgi:hypothetical protein